MRTLPLAVPLLLLWASPAPAQPQFELPVDCDMGRVCTVQNYVDHDPGPGARDYECGELVYNGHDGTDIRVPNMTHVARGVPVLAAAAGRVVGMRDGMPDLSVAEAENAVRVRGLECGNGVLIDHGAGWQTQVCHMKMGSVRVRTGDSVTAGQPLGLIGMSGAAEFPHVHFTVRLSGQAVDPFVGAVPGAACRAPRTPLWSAAALQKLGYVATGLLNVGFAAGAPTSNEVLEGRHQEPRLARNVAVLVFWVEIFGKQAGDRERLRVYAPDGAVVVDHVTEPGDRHRARNLTFAGARRTAALWPAGTYRGVYALERTTGTQTRVVLTLEQSVELR